MTSLNFKKRYPRQYARLIEFYGGRENIFDCSAAIALYLRGDAKPICKICNASVSITKKFRAAATRRCALHSNTNNIITMAAISSIMPCGYSIVSIPNKVLTRTDVITINCSQHGDYRTNIGNFLRGMRCQKCYADSRIGTSWGSHSATTKQALSIKKQGCSPITTNLSKQLKSLKQKEAWALRKANLEGYAEYTKNLSISRKKYLERHGFTFPKKDATKLELLFESFLQTNNIAYETQYVLDGRKFDFFLPNMLLLVEVDGEYWHRFSSSIKNDIAKHLICKNHGIQLVRISSDNYVPEIIFESTEVQNEHTRQLLSKRGINEF